MALPVDVEAVKQRVEDELSGTPYACSSLTPLSGGTANYIFRGNLERELPGGVQAVVVKHGEPYAALSHTLQLPTSRCVCRCHEDLGYARKH